MGASIYLDYNATAPVCPAAREAVTAALSLVGNPSSVHRAGNAARRLLEGARDAVRTLVRLPTADIVLTSGGTEANNLSLLGLDRDLIVSDIEHESVLGAARLRQRTKRIGVDSQGRIDLQSLKRTLEDVRSPAILSVMLANNETGVIQPVKEAAQLARDHGVLVHCDAVQGPGKIPLDMEELGVDLLSLSAHKFGGPMGVGALVVREGAPVSPRQVGGGQEGFRRAGTQNVPGIAGFCAAIEALSIDAEMQQRRDELEERCRALGAVVIADRVPRLPNTSCLSMPGVPSKTQVMAFDLSGIAVSAGAACSSGKVETSHVLIAMGVPPEIASTAIRVSLGPANGEHDIGAFVDTWARINDRAGRERAGWPRPNVA
jgi:cysteine desulfurase